MYNISHNSMAFMKKIIGAVLSIFLVMIITTGCFHAQYERGDFGIVLHTVNSIYKGVRSNKNVFEIDDVSMDLCYGFYDNKLEKQGKDKLRSQFDYWETLESELVMCIYIFDEIGFEKFKTNIVANRLKSNDYRNFKGAYLIKDIYEEDAFSGKYGYKQCLFGVRYDHSEKITIPQDIFSKDRGVFYITILTVYFSTPEDENYFVKDSGELCINYEEVELNKIKINF